MKTLPMMSVTRIMKRRTPVSDPFEHPRAFLLNTRSQTSSVLAMFFLPVSYGAAQLQKAYSVLLRAYISLLPWNWGASAFLADCLRPVCPQRGDAEMSQKLWRVVRSCVELGADNPIQQIHDQGAGGNCNVVKEIIYPLGAEIDVRQVPRPPFTTRIKLALVAAAALSSVPLRRSS